jgi:DNA (cytosine-5)-methyltransferase 1
MQQIDNFAYMASQRDTDSVVDLFCGGGGSGSGILKAYDRLGVTPSGTFVNHWDRAIEIHEANHPEHRHLKEDLFLLDPKLVFPCKTPVKLLWGSPSCQQFSLSRGNRPINEQGRSHADTVPSWVEHLYPEVVIIENVRQFKDYGPLRQCRNKVTKELVWAKDVPGKKKGVFRSQTFSHLDPAHARRSDEPESEWELRMISLGYDRHLEPDPAFKGEYFDAWVKRIEALGYTSDWKLLRSADYGDPTIRERLFVQFVRNDTGKRICWPDQRFIKPGAKRPDFKTNKHRELQPWPTARNSVIEWNVKGTSIFKPGKKPLAPATKRRIAIGLVKFGFRDLLLTYSKGFDAGVRSVDQPTATMTCNSRGEGLVTPFILPKDQGHKGDYVTDVDHPCCAVQTTAVDHLVEPCIIQNNGQSTAISVDKPLGAITGCHKQGMVEPFVSHLRNGSVGNTSTDTPLRALTAAGQHQMLVEAFLQVMDNAGKNGAQQRAYSVDEPVKTIPVKANQTLVDASLEPLPTGVKFTLETLEDAILKVAPTGIDVSQVIGLLEPLMLELKKVGRVDIRPWVYVYYSNGAVGADIDTPVPTVRCKEGTAICYPVLEFDGEFMLLDVLYRMLTVRELQRAQGFPDDFVWPAGISKTDVVKAIGNSVSCGVAESLVLAWYSQSEDISGFFETAARAA